MQKRLERYAECNESNVGLFCDFHNTLTNHNEVWESVFSRHLPPSEMASVIKLIYEKKESKKSICTRYHLNFNYLKTEALSQIKVNSGLLHLLRKFRRLKVVLILVSNTKWIELMDEVRQFGLEDDFDDYVTLDHGGKQDLGAYKKILAKHSIGQALLLGNDEFDDFIDDSRIVCVEVAEYLRLKEKKLGGYG